MFTIENDRLKVGIHAKGAELQSIYHKVHRLEYLWGADPAYWAKKSPVLFPVVGALKGDTYYYNGKSYQLPRHGFAREKTFSVSAQQDAAITFTLMDDKDTRHDYPFSFRLQIKYTLEEDHLHVTYTVNNTGDDAMYFSLGGHPAFKLPLVEGTRYEDYEMYFNKPEKAGRWPISKNGLIEKEALPFLNNTQTLPLAKQLFKTDALVFKNLKSDTVCLQSRKTAHGLSFHFPGFPFLGIWAASGADFLCIEPWCGIADSVDSTGQLQDKEGIVQLPSGDVFERAWHVHFY